MEESVVWQVLLVDDDEDFCYQAKDFLEGETVSDSSGRLQVETISSFDDAIKAIERYRFDLIILDVRLGSGRVVSSEEGAGIQTLESVKKRCFLPVVFYTAVPHLVRDLESPGVHVVEKTQGLSSLLETVKEVIKSGLPLINRALIRHQERVQCKYMWDFVMSRWKEFSTSSDLTALAYLLARRLALSLSESGIYELVRDLGGSFEDNSGEEKVHPMQYYVMPPLEDRHLAGDLYHGQIGEQNGYWVLLTPTCDIWQKKAERVLLASCDLLTNQPEYREWREGLPEPSNKVKKKFMRLLINNRESGQPERYFYLPGVPFFPDLVVDFQKLVAWKCNDLGDLRRLASLDSPFAGELLARFTRYFGRRGAPDLGVEMVMEHLKNLGTSSCPASEVAPAGEN
jgi:CheY-like chemotaxis protein